MASNKKITKEQKELCRIITPKFRVSYPHVFKPQAVKQGDKPKYSITMLFPKGESLDGLSPDGAPRNLKDVIKNAKLAEFGTKENWPDELESPVTDGDDPKHAKKEGYAGHWVIKATTGEDQKPSVLNKDKSPISDSSDFYPGCYARAYVYAYVWEYMNKKGVGFILDHVIKVADGKSFGGKKSAEEVFGPLGMEEENEETDEMDFK
jgi:hypothetical protein